MVQNLNRTNISKKAIEDKYSYSLAVTKLLDVFSPNARPYILTRCLQVDIFKDFLSTLEDTYEIMPFFVHTLAKTFYYGHY